MSDIFHLSWSNESRKQTPTQPHPRMLGCDTLKVFSCLYTRQNLFQLSSIKNSANNTEIDWRVILKGMVASLILVCNYAQNTMSFDKLVYKKAVRCLKCWKFFPAEAARHLNLSQGKFLATSLDHSIFKIQNARHFFCKTIRLDMK